MRVTNAMLKALSRKPKVLCPRCGRTIAQTQRKRHEDACGRNEREQQEAARRPAPSRLANE